MVDTVRSWAEIQALLANNEVGAISPQDLRDALLSIHSGHGSYYIGTPAETSIDTVNVWKKAAGVTITGLLHGFTNGTDNRLTYDQRVESHVTLSAFLSMVSASNNKVFELAIAKNGVVLPHSIMSRKISTSGDVGAAAVGADLDMVIGDTWKFGCVTPLTTRTSRLRKATCTLVPSSKSTNPESQMLIMEDASCQFTDAEFREQEASGTCPTEFMFAFELSWQAVHAQVESRGYVGRFVMSVQDFTPAAVRWTDRDRLRHMDIEPVMTQSANTLTTGANFRWMYHADFIRLTRTYAVLYTRVGRQRDTFHPYMVYEFPTVLTQTKLDALVERSLNLRETVSREPTLIISNSDFYDGQSIHHLRHGDVDDAEPEDSDDEINSVQDVLNAMSTDQLRDALEQRDSMGDFEYEAPAHVPTTRPKRRLLR